MKNEITLELLAVNWLAEKQNESAARARRLNIEAEMLALMPAVDEGTKNETCGRFKISATYSLNRKADNIALRAHWTEMSPAVQSCFRWTAEVILSELRRLSPETSAEAAKYITTAPAKPAFKIEEVK